MELPDWAHFCERCGTRVERPAASEDPIDHVGLDDTSASEPLWPEDAAAAVAESETFEPKVRDLPTLLMNLSAEIAESGDDFSQLADEMVNSQRDARPVRMGNGIRKGHGEVRVLDWQAHVSADEAADAAQPAADDAGDRTQPMPEDAAQKTQLMPEADAVAQAMPDDAQEDAVASEPDEPLSDVTQLMTAEAEAEEPYEADATGGEEAEVAEGEEPEPAADDHPEAAEDNDQAEPDGDEPSPAEDEGDDQQATGSEQAQDEQVLPEAGEGAPAADDAESRAHAVIDVGDDDVVYGYDSSVRHHVPDAWQGRQRPSQRHANNASTLPMTVVAAIAALAIVLGFGVAYLLLGGRGVDPAAEVEQPVATKTISVKEDNRIISSIDGWWTTKRTYDGRYWYIKDGIVETYAADGNLAKQTLIDPDTIEHMDAGPGGIEGAGCYLRSVAYYLLDDDPNTLYAIDQDGSADEDANLFRTDAPPFAPASSDEGSSASEEPEEPVEQADASEYMLPESNVRVYDTSELEALSDHDLFVARNEIYARHGYVFEAGELSDYFASKSWYHPSDVFNEGDITEVERQNVSTILALEQSRGSQYV